MTKFKQHVYHQIDVTPGYVYCLDCKAIKKAEGIHSIVKQIALFDRRN